MLGVKKIARLASFIAIIKVRIIHNNQQFTHNSTEQNQTITKSWTSFTNNALMIIITRSQSRYVWNASTAQLFMHVVPIWTLEVCYWFSLWPPFKPWTSLIPLSESGLITNPLFRIRTHHWPPLWTSDTTLDWSSYTMMYEMQQHIIHWDFEAKV